MCLNAVGQVVEASLVGNFAFVEAAREIADLVCDLVPRAVVLVGRGVRRWSCLLQADDEWV